MPILLPTLLNFQGSSHLFGVGSFSKQFFRTGLLEIDGDPEVLVHGKGMSVIGYLLSVYVQCRLKSDA